MWHDTDKPSEVQTPESNCAVTLVPHFRSPILGLHHFETYFESF